MNIGTDAQVQRYSVISRACLFFRNCGNSYGHSKQYVVNLKVYIRISISWIERHLGWLIGIHGIPNQFDEIGIYVADRISRNHDSNSKNPLGALVAWGQLPQPWRGRSLLVRFTKWTSPNYWVVDKPCQSSSICHRVVNQTSLSVYIYSWCL